MKKKRRNERLKIDTIEYSFLKSPTNNPIKYYFIKIIQLRDERSLNFSPICVSLNNFYGKLIKREEKEKHRNKHT